MSETILIISCWNFKKRLWSRLKALRIHSSRSFPAENRRQWGGFCRGPGPGYRVEGLHFSLPFFWSEYYMLCSFAQLFNLLLILQYVDNTLHVGSFFIFTPPIVRIGKLIWDLRTFDKCEYCDAKIKILPTCRVLSTYCRMRRRLKSYRYGTVPTPSQSRLGDSKSPEETD